MYVNSYVEIHTVMAEVKFYLEKRKDKATGKLIAKNVPIQLFYSFDGKRLQFFTGYRIDAFKWDEEKMKARKGFSESSDINKELDKLKTKVNDAHDKAKVLNEELTIEDLRDQLKGKQNIAKNKKSFKECLEEYKISSELTKSNATVKSIKSSFKNIADFSEKTGTKLEFKNITQDFYDALLEYCFNTRDYKNTYTGKLIKDIKAFLNWATDRGYNTNLDFKKKSFKKLTEEPEIIYLTYDELILLYDFDLEGNARLEQIRDIFCFGCFTGMRYSDILALAPEHIHKDAIKYRIVKTGQNNTIPLNPYSQKILKRYKDKIPDRCLPVVSEQKTNEYLKELFKKVKLNRKVQKISFQGAKSIKITSPLSEVITFHISKKTFMTNFLAKGGSLLTAMAITGNKDFKTARRYYKVVDTLKADEMAKVFGK
jgi:integrase